ncbi:2-phospho-L-lactate guanylyltransferase [Rathayibacter sp. VKM Ac-2759]|uniref:2-phospho-L-lactate guanylyltransferase n=1 Tax=Rathayibacter sp. VKM Ac-2759 TaxID=2609252 RepID=UPI0013185F3F|nr:2-phospho-L-lactate guanylyltransferase [Rathayibacter sp. VKM Ac-2759]QHC67001.1 2-phospho-L-lactate guanylyltransferase [Rathayibacter sp. VKM Ac-2759]
MSTGWSAVVVFKGRGSSKTRLELEARSALAEAFLLDTLAAVRSAHDVATLVLVTSDAEAAARAVAADPGVVVVADPGTLNAAVAIGVAHALTARPSARVIALTGDLPALAPADLDRALRTPVALPAVVPDRAGTGTTALLLDARTTVTPAFGPGSFARHLAAGCTAVDVPRSSTLRLDVDTVDDLRDAEAAGVGPRTARALEAAA